MSLDKIVVLALAIAFFGGIAFVYWKSKQAEQKAGKVISPAASDGVEDSSSKKLHGMNRKNSKS